MKTRMLTMQPIGRYVLPVQTWTPPQASAEDEFEYIDIASIDRESKCIASTTRLVVSEAPSRARQIVQSGDVLVSTVRPNLNAVARVSEALSGAIASTGFCVLRADQQHLHNDYLYHWVRTPQFASQMAREATGASYPAVTDRLVKASSLPLPPLTEQKRIAAILDKADSVRQKRRDAASLAGDLPLAIYRETFRAFLTAGAVSKPLAEVAAVVSGVAKGRRFNGEPIREVPYLRVANVQAGYLDLSEIKTIPATEAEIAELTLRRGDVLMTEGGDHDKLGRGALWEHDVQDCIHQNHIFRVRTDLADLLPAFFVYYLRTERAKTYFLRCAKKTTNLASINMRQLRALPVPVAPIELQGQFEKELATFRDAAIRQNRSAVLANDLFHSLVQRAFLGEL